MPKRTCQSSSLLPKETLKQVIDRSPFSGVPRCATIEKVEMLLGVSEDTEG